MQKKRKQDGFAKSLEQHREKLLSLMPTVKPASISYKNYFFPTPQGKQISISAYQPSYTKNDLPTIFYIPGTAFIANAPAYTHLISSHIAEKSRCQVIAIDFPLAPEYQFPSNIYAGYSVIKFLLNSPVTWTKINLAKVGLLGYSSGGNFATSIGILAKKEGLPITKLVLISPWLDLSCSRKGFEEEYENKDTTLPNPFLDWALNFYVPKEVKRDDPLLSPFWQNEKELKDLPETEIIVGEYDRFRGDTEKFYRKLLRANVAVNKLVVQGGDHSLWWQQIHIVQTIARRMGISLNSAQRSNFTAPAKQSRAFSL